MNKALCFAVVVALVTTSSVVLAFPFDNSWHMPSSGDTPNGTPSGTNRAGGNGIYGTGGARDFGIRCSNCHIEGSTPYGQIDATITPNPAWQQMGSDSAYQPGMQYTITVDLINEHRFNANGTSLNGFAATFEDAGGQTVGIFVADSGERSDTCSVTVPATLNPAVDTTFVYGDCHGVLAVHQPDRTQWTFDWIAPAAGTGDVTLFYSVVDGDGDGKSSLDDDVKEGTIVLREGT